MALDGNGLRRKESCLVVENRHRPWLGVEEWVERELELEMEMDHLEDKDEEAKGRGSSGMQMQDADKMDARQKAQK